MSRHLGLGIEEKPAVDAQNVGAADVALLWLGGHDFKPPEDLAGNELKEYLRAGGTLLASASCGSKAFDDAFVPWAQNLFGDDRWQTIPADDSIMTGSLPGFLGSTLHALTLRSSLDGAPPVRLDWPILYGVRDQGRWMLIYSPYDIACGLTGHPCIGCVGYVPRDATTLTANLVLHVATRPAP